MTKEEILTRSVVNIIPDKQKLAKLLDSGKKLNVYLGIDPTATQLHLGNLVPLRKLQHFLELGHNATLLIGDFTALIGDSSDKESERSSLTIDEIRKNYKDYKSQAEKILDFSKAKVRFNSEWLAKLSFTEIVKLCQHFSFGEFASRELIKKRLVAGKRVGLHEALYPVMQGYDSYFMDTDIQIGGADQTFNMQAGRTLQKNLRGKESFVVVTDYLEGTDGRKMSKTWGNAVWVYDTPNQMFGKIMSIKDELVIKYFDHTTNLSSGEVEKVKKALNNGGNPMEYKIQLAYQIVSELHSKKDADKAQKEFEKTFQKRQAPASVPEVKIKESSLPLLDLVFASRQISSRSEAKRLISQGGVDIDGKTATDPTKEFNLTSEGVILKLGKTKFVKIKKS